MNMTAKIDASSAVQLSLVSPDVSPALADAIRDLFAYTEDYNSNDVPPEEVPYDGQSRLFTIAALPCESLADIIAKVGLLVHHEAASSGAFGGAGGYSDPANVTIPVAWHELCDKAAAELLASALRDALRLAKPLNAA
jgi:hypothetical protein